MPAVKIRCDVKVTNKGANKKSIRITTPANAVLLNANPQRNSWIFIDFGDPVEMQTKLFEETLNFRLNVTCPLTNQQK